ncbi:MAG TPA: response regulator transcription factor [Rhizomicrobium sp.]|nr:response regulator transcription factor [Rhizomicrobium sp.]
MLVDDHPEVLRGLSRLLERGCEIVASVDNGEQALEAAVRLMPDVMVVDLTMPDMDGLEVCRRMQKSAPETEVIILTAFDDRHVELAALRAGASAFVAKHAAPATLEGEIQRLAEKKRTRA